MFYSDNYTLKVVSVSANVLAPLLTLAWKNLEGLNKNYFKKKKRQSSVKNISKQKYNLSCTWRSWLTSIELCYQGATLLPSRLKQKQMQKVLGRTRAWCIAVVKTGNTQQRETLSLKSTVFLAKPVMPGFVKLEIMRANSTSDSLISVFNKRFLFCVFFLFVCTHFKASCTKNKLY